MLVGKTSSADWRRTNFSPVRLHRPSFTSPKWFYVELFKIKLCSNKNFTLKELCAGMGMRYGLGRCRRDASRLIRETLMRRRYDGEKPGPDLLG